MPKNWFLLLYVVLLDLRLKSGVSAKNLVVATYNLWNVMFQWDSRKYHIADLIREANPDIIGFQEVRAQKDGKQNQLKQLQSILPEYKYRIYHPTKTVESSKFGKKAIQGWEEEGIGILSKHSLVMSHHIPLSKSSQADPSPRELLQVQIEYEGHEVFYVLVHFSTDKSLQCQNAMRLINFITSNGADRTVIAGDFNTYSNYEWPIQAIMNGFFEPNGCPPQSGFEKVGNEEGYGFDDSWPSTSLDKKGGMTFSNMPFPGLINRPDRVLVSRVGLDPVKTTLYGHGLHNGSSYSFWNYVSRFNTITQMSKNRWQGDKEFQYTCHIDCGPHGSCRCGVCVGGGDAFNCDLDECTECTSLHYHIIVMLRYTFTSFLVGVAYLSFCLVAKHSKLKAVRSLIFCPRWFAYRHLTLYLSIGFVLFYSVVKFGLSDVIRLVFDRIPEELYASDHLMVVSEIKISYH